MLTENSSSKRRIFDRSTTFAVVLSALSLFTTPLRHQANLMAYAQDDLYYYLVAARNLATGHGSTFDGTTMTNGYHPLYFVLFWSFYHFASGIVGLFRFLAVLDTLSALTIFLASRALLARRLKNVWLTNGLALAMLCVCYPKLQHQMEVTLTIPLVLLFLCVLDFAPESISVRRWLGAGIIGSLMVLSRLDSVILLILLGVGALFVPSYREAITRAKLLAFLAGLLPLLIGYLVINEVYFHRLMPISGAAKQLKAARGFTWSALTEHRGSFFTLIVIVLVFALLVMFHDRLAKEQRVLYAAALGFPVIHWLLEIWRSDWKVWPWYSYSLRSAMLVVFLLAGILLTRRSSPRTQQNVGIVVFAVFLMLSIFRRYPPEKVMPDTYSAAEGIRDFSRTHPGRYAMGDRAGMVGYLDGQPTLQTEGLMMDDAFLGHIQRQEPLRDVLKDYHVDYYVGFSEHLGPAWQPVSGCFEAREPAQAGPSSPTLRSEFCEKPVWTLIQTSGETMIFDLRGENGTPL